MRRLLPLFFASFIACATVPPPATVPTMPSHLVQLGINDGFHGPIPSDVVLHYCNYPTPPIIRSPQVSVDMARSLLASLAVCAHPFPVVILVEAPDVTLAQSLAAAHLPVTIELGNELELAPSDLTIDQFLSFEHEAWAAIRAVNPTQPVITGGVYALTADTELRLQGVVSACPDCTIGIHVYQPLTSAQTSFLMALGKPIAVTESGYPTLCVADRVAGQMSFLSAMRATVAQIPTVTSLIIYQRPTGPTCSALDTYGLQDLATHWNDSIFQ